MTDFNEAEAAELTRRGYSMVETTVFNDVGRRFFIGSLAWSNAKTFAEMDQVVEAARADLDAPMRGRIE